MPRIVNSFISERLIPAVSIEKLIGSFMALKKSGSNYVCCCPFHQEKTPSFNVSPSRQMYYCFGCKEHGDAIDFLMKYKNLGFVEAVEELAAFAGLQVEYEQGARAGAAARYEPYYELMQRCAAAFSRALFDPRWQQALDYFTRKRELSRETIMNCGLGFAPDSRNFLQQEVCRSPEDERRLIELGMLVKHDERPPFPMFRGRVMIPIYDRKGRVISFGGRSLGSEQPKYMNTKETLIYRKRNELFGLYEALQATNNRPERLVIVEGYMDVIAVRQAGFSTAVASLGTSTTPGQFKLMMRYTKKIICCYDGDAAGRKAAWHALQTAAGVLTAEVEMRFAFLPPEHDPDSLVRAQGLSAFVHFLDNAMSYPEFLISHTMESYQLQDPGQLTAFIADALRRISVLPLKPLQAVSLTLLARASGIEERQLYDMLPDSGSVSPEHARTFAGAATAEAETAGGAHILTTPMRRIMAFILQHPSLVDNVYAQFDVETFISLCLKLRIRGAHELEDLLHSIHDSINRRTAPAPGEEKTSDITPAVLLARTRGTPREKIYRTLMSVPIGAAGRNREEVSLEKNLEFFAELISGVLVEPLRRRADYLTLQAGHAGPEVQQEVTEIRGELARRGLLQARS